MIKALAVFYSFILVIFGSGIIVLSLGSPHNLDVALIILNWATAVSFPFIIYYLNRFFYTKKYKNAILFFLVVNCIIFFYSCYDIIKNSDDGLSDASLTLLIPLLGFLLSMFFTISILLKPNKIVNH